MQTTIDAACCARIAAPCSTPSPTPPFAS
jgi:hypothetical protein